MMKPLVLRFLCFLVVNLFGVAAIYAAPNSDAALPPDPLPEKLASAQVRSEEAQDRIVAAAWYDQGRVLRQREDDAGALHCYERAWRWDKRAISALHEIVPLAFELKREEEAARYAVMAAENAPRDPILLRRLALFLTEKREWARAAALYERAIAIQPGGGTKIDDVGSALVHFELGRLYFLAGDFQKSAAAFARVRDLLLDPVQPLGEQATKTLLGKPDETWLLLGESFLAAGRHDEAAVMFTKSNDATSDQPLLALRLARVAAARKNRDGALQKLDEYFAAKTTVAGTEPYAILSKLLTDGVADAKTAHAAVIKRLQELRRADESNEPLRFYLAEELADSGQLAEAEKLYQESLTAKPRLEVAERLVELYRRQGNAEKILEAAGPFVARAHSLEPIREPAQKIAGDQGLVSKIVEAARRIAKEPADKRPTGELLAAAFLALDGKQFDAAEELFTAEVAGSAEKKGEVLLAWGLGLLGKDEHARSAKVLQKIIDDQLLADRAAIVHYFLAGALAMSGDDAHALRAAKKSVEIDPKNPLFESRVAWVYYRAKDLPSARREYEEVLARHDGEYKSSTVREVIRETRLALSNIAVKQGDFAGGVERLEQVLDEFPDDAGALNDLGYLWIERGLHLSRAVSMVQKAVAAEPENASYRDSLGWGYYQLGRFADAAGELALAADKEPGGVILDHLGDAHSQAGDAAKARAAWQKAVEALEKEGDKERLELVKKKLSG